MLRYGWVGGRLPTGQLSVRRELVAMQRDWLRLPFASVYSGHGWMAVTEDKRETDHKVTVLHNGRLLVYCPCRSEQRYTTAVCIV